MATPSGDDARGLVLISAAVGQMVVPILLGVWFDNTNNTSPWGMVVGSVLGIVGGSWSLWAISRRMNRNEPPPTGSGSSPPEN
jgi:F0F1-type ATP synthase assembly protein I